ncbi:MAG: sulfatase-like hydrolase/transferase [Phycisphaerae bacterium]|jgi:arylsulfatase A-like enzyme|nr:sulfatase-like hydrolase/transferase [Phycisphaerae bacterium]
MSRRRFHRWVFGASVAIASARGAEAAPKPKAKINLLFIMTDQQRFDAMSCAGNTVLKTPNLDRLAGEGAYFENAYSNCPICVPARAVILTGCGIDTVGVTGNNDYDRPDVAKVPTFDNILARNGYHTEYYGKWHTPYRFAATYKNTVRQTGKHSKATGVQPQHAAYRQWLSKQKIEPRTVGGDELLDKGTGRPYSPDAIDWRFGKPQTEWDRLSREARKKQRAADRGAKAKRKKGMNPFSQAGSYGCLHIPAACTRTAFVAGEVLDALDRVKDKPFSLTCSFGPPHPPMILPKPYYGMYPAAGIEAPKSIGDPMDNSPYARRAGEAEMRRYRNKAHVRQMTSNYYGMVREIDDWVGRILARLDKHGLTDNTLVIFTSDHGEMLGDHGMHSKMVLYEGSAHIPLLMRLPGAIKPGSVVKTPVAHVDLLATILDYLSMPACKSDGRSLRKLIDGQEDGIDFCVSQWRSGNGPNFMIRTRRWKLLTSYNPKSQIVDALYDLETDPHEMNNLIGRDPNRKKHIPQAEKLKTKLIAWLKKTKSPHLKGVRARELR